MWIWIIAAVLAYFVKGLCGFGNTLVFTSILGFGNNNIDITPVDLMLTYPPNLILTWKNRKSLKAKIYLPLTALVLVGIIPGALLLKNVGAHAIKVVFGAVIILIGIEMFFRSISSKKMKESKLLLLVIGILSGVLSGMFGIGALLAAYVGRVTTSDSAFKANISFVFAAENTFRIVLYLILGIITIESVKLALFAMPFVLLGLWLGMKSAQTIDEKWVNRLVILLLIVSGIIMIVRR